MKLKKPKIIILSGISIDGKMTIKRGFSSKFFDKMLDKEAFKPLLELRKECDGIMVGRNTVVIDNPSLTSPNNENLKRIIPTSSLRIPLTAKIFRIHPQNTIIATISSANKKKIRKILKTGARVIFCGKRRLNFKLLMNKLYNLGIRTLLVEGGGLLNYSLLYNRLVDEIRVLFLPFVVGNKDAPSFFDGRGFPNKIIKLKLKSVKMIARKYILVTYSVIYER